MLFFLIDILSTLNGSQDSFPQLFSQAAICSLFPAFCVKIFVSTTNVIVARKLFIKIVHFESFIGGNHDI